MDAQGSQGQNAAGWRAWIQRRRTTWRSLLTPRNGIGLVVALVVVALVASSLPKPGPTLEPTAGPTGGSGPTASPRATEPPAEAWGDLELPAWEPIAELRPVDMDASGVAVRSAFVLRSRTTTPATDLVAGLSAEPSVSFQVQPGGSAAEVTVRPAEQLSPGIVYRFRLADQTGALAGSWAYRTERPLHVVSTVPGPQATSVPVNTGIEIEFDQDGVTDISEQFSIVPAVPGRFEAHARTIVFVPTSPLAAAAVYRITIAAGVAMAGSDQVLEAPVSFAFETATSSGTAPTWDVGLGRPILEAAPTETPLIGVDLVVPQGVAAPAALPFEVYRLSTLAEARAAAVTLTADDGWFQWAADLVPTAGLARVATFDGTFESSSPYGYKVVRFPEALAAGWYLVVVPREGRDRQVLLQVTTLSAYALTSETRTVSWVNDIGTGEPVSGATLSDPSGVQIGTTAEGGLLDVPTPASLRTDSAVPFDGTVARTPILTITAPDGRQLLLALGLQSRTGAYDYERNDGVYASAQQRWWLLMSTDRTTYRSTDTVHAWGLIQSRLDGSVPGSLEATLHAASQSEAGPWLGRVPVITTPRGAWAVDLELKDLALGDYIVELRAGGEIVSSTWIRVDQIRKPAYQIEVTTDALAYLAGDTVSITGRASFFDGTPASGISLRVNAFGITRTLTADADGRVTMTRPAATTGSGIDSASITVQPESPEEGEISGSAAVYILSSAAWLEASATVTGAQLEITGTLSEADLARVEQEIAEKGWVEDVAGAPIAGRTVTIRVAENVATRTQRGTTYDYIEKVAIPVYDYTYVERPIGTYTTTSGVDGSINLSVPVTNGDSQYSVTLTARDAAGRTASAYAQVSPPDNAGGADRLIRPYLVQPQCGGFVEEHDVGDILNLTVHDGDGTVSAGGRYLFVVAGQGIRDALVQDTATLQRPYGASELGGLGIIAVRFENGAYVVTREVQIRPKAEGRTLNVELEADRARYAPAGTAQVAIRVTDRSGSPVAADVVLRAVDEKLYRIGGAQDVDALGSLLVPLGDGLLQSYASHPLPMPSSEGCEGGDTSGGGGDREDFEDSALFEIVSTGSDGRGSVEFDLPEDLTSWHLSATALAGDLRAGDASILVPVGLPFFADAILAPEYLVGERPILRVRSFGDDLAPDARVRFTISAPSLALTSTTVEAASFATATLELPELPVGVHDIKIAATIVGDSARKDTLVRRIVVRWSRLEVATTETTTAEAAGRVGGAGLTTYIVTDAGRGSLLPPLQALAYGSGARFDRQLAADMARDLLVSAFALDETGLPSSDFDVSRYQRGGVALLPYSSTDLALTAMTAIVAPEHLRAEDASAALREWMTDTSATRERAIIALAGLAGLGDDVLDDLHAIDVGEVTVREALWVALGLVAAGDEDGARAIERALLEADGQALGPWVRLDVGDSLSLTLDATSLLALVATGIGDPLAPSIARYVREMTTTEGLYVLPEIGVIRWSLDRLPRATASFAWSVEGARHEERLEPGASWSVSLTEGQREGFEIETLTGSVAVVATWTRAPGADQLPSGDVVTITRTVAPVGTAPMSGVVRVQLSVVFSADAPTGCWDVSDYVPSGLAPLVTVPGWAQDGAPARSLLAPYEVAGQRVSWCLDPSSSRGRLLSYAARVVSGGTFTWEPAVIQSVTAPEVGATTPITTYTIR